MFRVCVLCIRETEIFSFFRRYSKEKYSQEDFLVTQWNFGFFLHNNTEWLTKFPLLYSIINPYTRHPEYVEINEKKILLASESLVYPFCRIGFFSFLFISYNIPNTLSACFIYLQTSKMFFFSGINKKFCFNSRKPHKNCY